VSDRGAELLQAVIDAPDDVAPRLAYADYLSEQGDPRGEFIRAQIQLQERINPARRRRAKRRERELFWKHRAAFGEAAQGLTSYPTFRRGFIETLRTDASKFVPAAEEFMTKEPVRHLMLWNTRTEHLRDLLAQGVIGRLLGIAFSGSMDADGARLLAESEQLASLFRVNLGGTEIGDEGVIALASSPHLVATSLTLYRVGMTDAGLDALCAWPGLPACTHLYLARNDITDAGAARLAAANVDSLKMLGLGGCDSIGDAGALAFAKQSLADSMHRVEFEYCTLSADTIARLRDVWGDRVLVTER
jgi:uncharacterized protein (TIGR02996 family)